MVFKFLSRVKIFRRKFECLQKTMLPIAIIGASSLANAKTDVRTSMNQFNLIAEQEMSTSNDTDDKNIYYKVIKRGNWREPQFVR